MFFGTDEDSTIDVEVSDMNMDGHKDLILSNRDSQPNYVYLNDGILNFNKKIMFGQGNDNTRAVEIGDFNSDGYKDIATANIDEPNFIYFGDEFDSFDKHVIYDN